MIWNSIYILRLYWLYECIYSFPMLLKSKIYLYISSTQHLTNFELSNILFQSYGRFKDCFISLWDRGGHLEDITNFNMCSQKEFLFLTPCDSNWLTKWLSALYIDWKKSFIFWKFNFSHCLAGTFPHVNLDSRSVYRFPSFTPQTRKLWSHHERWSLQ